jgi:hypothetical protein
MTEFCGHVTVNSVSAVLEAPVRDHKDGDDIGGGLVRSLAGKTPSDKAEWIADGA